MMRSLASCAVPLALAANWAAVRVPVPAIAEKIPFSSRMVSLATLKSVMVSMFDAPGVVLKTKLSLPPCPIRLRH